MKKNVKVLVGVVIVAAVAVGGYFFGNGSGLKGCIGRGCLRSAKSIDLAVTSLKAEDKKYNGVPYYRFTAGIKNNGPEAEWSVKLNGDDYTKYMGWKKVPANINTYYSFDIMQSVACGAGLVNPQVQITLDPNEKITESDEGNNSLIVTPNTACPIDKKAESLVSCDGFGGKWVTLVDGEYTYVYDPVKSSDNKSLFKVDKNDILNLFQSVKDSNYSKYCYTQESLDPKNDKLNAARLCDSMNMLYSKADGVTDENNYSICKIIDKLPAGPDMISDQTYLYDKVGLSTSTGSLENGFYGMPSIYKDRMTFYKALPGGNASTSFFMNAFDMFGQKISQKFRITIRGQK